jgi:ABC-type antimicrobial peptide transport system permease subunit
MIMFGFMPRTMNLVVRSTSPTPAVADAVRSAVKQVDSGAAVSGIAPMQAIVDRTIAQPRLLAWMFGAFAVLALLVAGVGVYAVTSYAVSARTTEFGVRLALGARPADLLRLVLAGGMPAVAAGLAVGLLASLAVARLLRNLLFDVEPLDPASLAAGAAVMALSAVAATILPARRAARVDPLTALRE